MDRTMFRIAATSNQWLRITAKSIPNERVSPVSRESHRKTVIPWDCFFAHRVFLLTSNPQKYYSLLDGDGRSNVANSPRIFTNRELVYCTCVHVFVENSTISRKQKIFQSGSNRSDSLFTKQRSLRSFENHFFSKIPFENVRHTVSTR